MSPVDLSPAVAAIEAFALVSAMREPGEAADTLGQLVAVEPIARRGAETGTLEARLLHVAVLAWLHDAPHTLALSEERRAFLSAELFTMVHDLSASHPHVADALAPIADEIEREGARAFAATKSGGSC